MYRIMKVCPINNTYSKKSNRHNFTGKANVSPQNVMQKIKSVIIPAAAFAAMAPGLVNAQMPENKQTVQQEQKIESGQNLPYYLQPEYVVYKKDFDMEGEKYTMMYADYGKRFTERENTVSDIFFVPEDFKLIKSGEEELNQPPKLTKLIKHNNKDNSYFVEAVTSEIISGSSKDDTQYITKGIILPEEIGNELLKLYEGKSGLSMIPSESYIDTNSPELQETKIQTGRKPVSL